MASYEDDAEDSAVLDDVLESVPTAFCADTGEINDELTSKHVVDIAESACVNDAMVINVVGYLIIESALLNDAVSIGHTHVSNVAESGVLDDATSLVLLANLVDSVDAASLNDALQSSVVTQISESAALGDAATYAFTWAGNVIEAGALGDQITSFLSDSIDDAAVLNDALVGILSAVNLVVESAVLNDAVLPSTRATTLVVEVAVLGDAIEQRATTTGLIVESGEIGDHMTGGGAGGGWRAHAESFAMSRHTNQPWNSFAVVDGRLVGGSDDGAYLLEGASDAGVAIDAAVEYDWLNHKPGRDGRPVPSSQLKRPRYLYLDYRGTGVAVVLKYVHNGSEASASYELDPRVANAFINGRAQLGRGIRSVYLKPRISNTDGSDIAVNAGRIAVDELERSIA